LVDKIWIFFGGHIIDYVMSAHLSPPKNYTTKSDVLPINTDFPINNKYKSINFDFRIRQIIIHYTVENTQKSFDILLGKEGREVSAHYIINNVPTEKYPDFIYQIVSDSKRNLVV
jgi:N-acetyl-anhydromuramyl-L-alanine amidase AmpD